MEKEVLDDDFNLDDDTPITQEDDFELESDDSEEKEIAGESENDEEEVEETEEIEEQDEAIDNKEKATVKVKFLHQEFEYDHDDPVLITLVQKGMNHDRVLENYEKLKSDESFEIGNEFKEISEMFDMTPKKLAAYLKEQYFESVAAENGLTVEAVKKEQELKERENKLALEEKKKAELEKLKQDEEKSKEEQQKMVKRFLDKYPNVTYEMFDAQTIEALNSGEDLLSAYQDQLIRQQNEKIKLAETQKNNTKKAPVRGTADTGKHKNMSDDWDWGD